MESSAGVQRINPKLHAQLIAVAAAALVLLSASGSSADVTSLVEALKESPADETLPLPSREAIAEFYEDRGYAPVWITDDGLNEDARSVLQVIKDAPDWGLESPTFAETLRVSDEPAFTSAQLASIEMKLSAAVVTYAEQATGGRVANPSGQLSSYLDRRPAVSLPLSTLQAVSRTTEPAHFLVALHPQHEQFQRLKDLYRALEEEQRLIQSAALPARGVMLMAGRRHPDVRRLRVRLGVTATAGAEDLFDDTLEAAVRRFQADHGCARDGVVGPRTRRALNADVGDKVEAIRANMEQWRWMPRKLGREYIAVNVPSYRVDFVQDGKTVASERAIVGTRDTQTPIFSNELQMVVLRPRWYVPESIKVRELLPSLLAGRSLESMGFGLMRDGRELKSQKIDWWRADIRKFDVYQASGDANALGDVKFLFPNKHAVYLHDTPGRYKFRAEERAFSHGCIRVDNPLRLAQAVLQPERGWSQKDLQTLVDKGPLDDAIPMQKPLPVHITYFTVTVGDDGQPRYFRDIYGHQQRVTLALRGKFKEIDKGRDHLEPVEVAMKPKRPSTRDKAAAVKTRWKPAAKPRAIRVANFAPPIGLFKASGSGSYGATANDIFRRSFGN